MARKIASDRHLASNYTHIIDGYLAGRSSSDLAYQYGAHPVTIQRYVSGRSKPKLVAQKDPRLDITYALAHAAPTPSSHDPTPYRMVETFPVGTLPAEKKSDWKFWLSVLAIFSFAGTVALFFITRR